jgi:hypothetical protein
VTRSSEGTPLSNAYWVTSVTYALEESEEVKFNACPPVEFTNPVGTFRLHDGTLIVSLVPERFDSREAAKEAIQPVLDAWRALARLTEWNTVLSFRYLSSTVEPKVPPPAGSTVVHAQSFSTGFFGGSAKLTFTRAAYPPPPINFVMSAHTATLWARYEQCEAGREPLPGMAYFVETYLKEFAGGRNYFGVSGAVRDTLGRLSSTKGDMGTARKANTQGALSAIEQEWLRAAVRGIIKRAAQDAAGITPEPLTMADLPKLP